ncbi:MAG: hypothetical protein IPL26_11545 [Leptospiraceae bacterium]|nr:hypothetical protein [Leptospiraceae bacterium]
MEAYRIQTKLVSEIIKLPQITKWIGQEVEIIILPIKEVETSILQKINSLVGTVLEYIDPFEPIEENSWEALH